MHQLSPQPYCLARRFDDFDELSEVAQTWDLDFRQLDRGRFSGELVQVVTARVQLAFARFDRRLEQRGSPPRDAWTFGIPAEECTPHVWRGQEVTSRDIVVLPPGSELDSVSLPGFALFPLSVPEALLEEVGEIVGVVEARELLRKRQVFTGGRKEVRRLRRSLGRVCRTATMAQRGVHTPELRYALEYEIPAELFGCLAGGSQGPDGARGWGRGRAVERAVAYLEKNAIEAPRVRELSRASGVSERTLERAFRDRFGVSPKTYVQAYRLNGVRKTLRRSNPASSRVNDVANEWGFWHMGQFAADYRAMFGELPSETLRSVGSRSDIGDDGT